MKHSFVGQLMFGLKRKNRKGEENHVFLATASTKRASLNHKIKQGQNRHHLPPSLAEQQHEVILPGHAHRRRVHELELAAHPLAPLLPQCVGAASTVWI
jgi:hypothetical protein